MFIKRPRMSERKKEKKKKVEKPLISIPRGTSVIQMTTD